MTVGVFACLQVDSERRDLDMNDRDVDAEKLTRFVRMNELRLVTEYNPVVIINSLHSSPLSLAFLLLMVSSGPRLHIQMCEGWSNGVDGIEEATQPFTAAPHMDWKQIFWGRNVVGEEGTNGISFGFPVNLGC